MSYNYENWKTMAQISDSDEQHEFIKTGLYKLDRETQGLILGATSIWTGTNGSNKSGTIGQIALNVVNGGKSKVAIFSGELPDKRFKRWLYLQACGDLNVRKKADDGSEIEFYITPEEYRLQITDWLSDRLYLYDNSAGFAIESVGNAIYELIKNDSEVKLVFVDNLFTLGIEKLSADKYEAQKNLLLKMTRLAQEYNVHMGFVCHPRKISSLIRKEDVSGSSDITNVADNVFILHRNTVDFKVRAKDYFKFREDDPIFDFDNLIEIAKDRESGNIEKFLGFGFDRQCKRILNYPREKFRYKWRKDDYSCFDAQMRIEEIQTDELPY